MTGRAEGATSRQPLGFLIAEMYVLSLSCTILISGASVNGLEITMPAVVLGYLGHVLLRGSPTSAPRMWLSDPLVLAVIGAAIAAGIAIGVSRPL